MNIPAMVSPSSKSAAAAENPADSSEPTSANSAADASAAADTAEPSLNVKVRQLKTKVTERVGKDGKVSWKVDVGSARVMVYSTPFREKGFYTLSYWVDQKRIRRVYPDKDKAIEEATGYSRWDRYEWKGSGLLRFKMHGTDLNDMVWQDSKRVSIE